MSSPTEILQEWSGKMIGEKQVLVVAEAGVNHNGSIDLAYQLIDAAVAAGADVVKFQTWKTENVVTRSSPKAEYQRELIAGTQTLFAMLKQLELSFEVFKRLKTYCDEKKIIFLSTADEIESATFLNSLQSFFKIGSAELNDIPFLRAVARFGKPMIVSSGMGTLAEIGTAIDVITSEGLSKDKLTVLHCTTEYPVKPEEVNLLAIPAIHRAFDVNVGYSDHTLGIHVPVAAVALGARVIEKHFTLNREMEGPDHKASLEPDELKAMVRAIRDVEICFGDGVKKPSSSELHNMPSVRKSIVARRNIQKGEEFSIENIAVKRPGTGLPPTLWDSVIGKVSTRNYAEDDFIELP
jgi:N,N'-diacetyllegionaminate synthase